MISPALILTASQFCFNLSHEIANTLSGYRDPAPSWNDALMRLKGQSPTLWLAVQGLTGEEQYVLSQKVKRLLDDRRKELRRERWADAWARLQPTVCALGVMAALGLILALTQWADMALFGPGGGW